MFCHEERHILPRSGRMNRETYEKYDRFDGELVRMTFSVAFVNVFPFFTISW